MQEQIHNIQEKFNEVIDELNYQRDRRIQVEEILISIGIEIPPAIEKEKIQ